MKKNIFRITIVLMIILAIGSFVFLLNQSTEGIQHGIYSRVDDEGNILNEGFEGAWIIRNGEAEHRYLIYRIVKIDEKIYFEIERIDEGLQPNEETGLFRYEVIYDKEAKILTVIMPVDDGGYPSVAPTTEYEMKTFQFKKTGFSIAGINIL